jgi:hypothetical protein
MTGQKKSGVKVNMNSQRSMEKRAGSQKGSGAGTETKAAIKKQPMHMEEIRFKVLDHYDQIWQSPRRRSSRDFRPLLSAIPEE